MQVENSTVSGEFPLTPMTPITETQIAQGFEITVEYAITPEENYAGPPGTLTPTKPVDII